MWAVRAGIFFKTLFKKTDEEHLAGSLEKLICLSAGLSVDVLGLPSQKMKLENLSELRAKLLTRSQNIWPSMQEGILDHSVAPSSPLMDEELEEEEEPIIDGADEGEAKRKRTCRHPGCTKVIKSQGHCQRHGAKAKRCRVDKHEGMCKRHFKVRVCETLDTKFGKSSLLIFPHP